LALLLSNIVFTDGEEGIRLAIVLKMMHVKEEDSKYTSCK
jgi:hypothetical protein